jgi:hypothetical protein
VFAGYTAIAGASGTSGGSGGPGYYGGYGGNNGASFKSPTYAGDAGAIGRYDPVTKTVIVTPGYGISGGYGVVYSPQRNVTIGGGGGGGYFTPGNTYCYGGGGGSAGLINNLGYNFPIYMVNDSAIANTYVTIVIGASGAGGNGSAGSYQSYGGAGAVDGYVQLQWDDIPAAANVTGVSGTGVVSFFSPVAGVKGTGVVGNVTVTTGGGIIAAGNTGTGQIGTVGFVLNNFLPVTGVSGTGVVGLAIAGIGPIIVQSGVQGNALVSNAGAITWNHVPTSGNG